MKPTLHSFAYALDFLREQVADVSPADMVRQPGGFVNHPAWTIGHLTMVCQNIGGAIGLAPWLPDDWPARYGTGSVPTPHTSVYEPKADALARLADAQSRLTRAVAQLDDNDDARLDAPFPDPAYRDVFPSIRHALTQVLVAHTAYHVGQLTSWRRALRLPPIGRAFE